MNQTDKHDKSYFLQRLESHLTAPRGEWAPDNLQGALSSVQQAHLTAAELVELKDRLIELKERYERAADRLTTPIKVATVRERVAKARERADAIQKETLEHK
jgi:hypothetical protein